MIVVGRILPEKPVQKNSGRLPVSWGFPRMSISARWKMPIREEKQICAAALFLGKVINALHSVYSEIQTLIQKIGNSIRKIGNVTLDSKGG